MLKAIELKCEYVKNPIGIGERNPRFSWIIESDGKNVLQRSYHLQIAADEKFKNIIWDTGMVESDRSVNIMYQGPSLSSCTRYFFRVKITDNKGAQSEWSETAFFETALLDSFLWKAKFISPEGDDEAGSSKGKYLRKEFALDGEIESARVYATALGLYELYINGCRVGDALFAPGWTSYNKRLLYQTYDVTDMLNKGANAVGALIGCGWYKGDLAGWLGRRNVYGNRTALLLQMIIRCKNGKEYIIVSDDSWKASDSPVLFSEIYHGEIYDARLEQPGWNCAGFDDSGWYGAYVIEKDMSLLTAQDGLPVKKHESFKPLCMFTTPRGEKVLDFGQNMAGWVKFSVKGKPGEKVILKHAEVLDSEGNFYTENLRSAKAAVEYIIKGNINGNNVKNEKNNDCLEKETFEPHFTFQGFRYVLIEEYPGEPLPDDFTAYAIYSDMEPTGYFECSNPLLNQLQKNISWGMKGNFLDIPTDCPQRDERLGWTGDAQVFIRTAAYLMNIAPFFKKWLRDLKADQLENGGVPYVIPDVLTKFPDDNSQEPTDHSSTGWGDAAVICPWTIYQCFDDESIIKNQYESMKAWVEYIRKRAQNGVLWNTGFHFADWLALDAKEGSYLGAIPNDLVATAFYAYSTQLLCKTARVLGYKEDYEKYAELYKSIVKAFQDEFFTPSGRLAARTQTAHVLALMFDLVPEQHRMRTVNTLADLIKENGGHLTTGFLGTPYLCHVLSQNGKLEDAYKLLLREEYPSWLYQVKMGATTIWEHWDGIKPDGSMWSKDMNSFNHYAYGSIGDWMYRTIAGIDTDSDCPGYKKIIIKPQPGGNLTFAKAEYKSMYGLIKVEWKIENKTMIVNIHVPHNTTAVVMLPNACPERICTEGVVFEVDGEAAKAEIGSGSYTFSYEYQL